VLTTASIAGAVDHLHGLKENVIIGHLIPAARHEEVPAGEALRSEWRGPGRDVSRVLERSARNGSCRHCSKPRKRLRCRRRRPSWPWKAEVGPRQDIGARGAAVKGAGKTIATVLDRFAVFL